MGYKTHFTLVWEPLSTDNDKVVADAIAANEEASCCLCPDGLSGEPGDFYEPEEWLKSLSKQLPAVRLTLHGEGEDPGDLWRCYAYKGRTETVKAKISYPPCHLSGWEIRRAR